MIRRMARDRVDSGRKSSPPSRRAGSRRRNRRRRARRRSRRRTACTTGPRHCPAGPGSRPRHGRTGWPRTSRRSVGRAAVYIGWVAWVQRVAAWDHRVATWQHMAAAWVQMAAAWLHRIAAWVHRAAGVVPVCLLRHDDADEHAAQRGCVEEDEGAQQIRVRHRPRRRQRRRGARHATLRDDQRVGQAERAEGERGEEGSVGP